MDEGRVIVSIVWGTSVVVVWGKVLRDGWQEWTHYRDNRAKAEFLTELGLFLTSVASLGAILAFLLSPTGTPVSRVASTLALGAFLGAGIIAATLGGRNRR